MVGVMVISQDHLLILKIASVDPYALRNVSAAFRQPLYSITFEDLFENSDCPVIS
jgi:hypothetical protein